MATILRSSRYIRCLNGVAQRIIVAYDKTNNANKFITNQARCINSYLTKSYATIPAIKSKDNSPNFDSIFNNLDMKVQRYGRVFYHEVDDVLAKVRDAGYIPSLDALLLIRCCGDFLVDTVPQERNRLVQEIWSTLDTLRIPVDISHFNALLRVYLENNYEFSPTEFLTQLNKKGVEPNKVTYQRLILAYCKRGDIEGATRILEFMKSKDIPLSENVFNALITGHSEANDMESAKNILNLMTQVNVEPGASTYCALLRAYAKRGDMESIRNTLKEIESKDMSLQDKDFLDIVHVLAANGYNNEVDEILSMLPFAQGYNVEAVHAILKVLDVGNPDVALKILGTMRRRQPINTDEDESENSSGTFLVKKLINAKYPAEKIIKTCIEMEKQGLHTRAFSVAIERALDNGNVELSVELLKAWKKNGGTIREHYFWPLIVVRGKACNFQGIHDLLQSMVKDFDIVPGFETIRDYILPFTVGKWDETITTMKEFNVPHTTIISAIANRLLLDKKIRKAAMFMTSYPINYVAEPMYRPLSEALSYTGDAKSFTVILRFLYDSAVRVHEEHNDKEKIPLPEYILHEALQTMLETLTVRKSSYVDDVLSYMVEAGITISSEMGDKLREYFSENATPNTYANIEKLTSGSLELTPLSEFNTYDSSNGNDVNNVEPEGNGKIFAAKRRQLAYSLRTGNLDTIKAIIDDMDRLNFTFSPAVCAQIIEVACREGDIEMAETWVKRLNKEHPDDRLDLQKATKYAALLINNNRFDDALQFILEQPRKENPENHPPMLRRLVKQLLDAAAETGNVEKTNQLFEALVESNYLTVDNYVLGPLVRVHLVKNDLEGALEAFQKACLTHQCTPLKNELSKKFIDAEDANSLQRLTDLSTQIHGESNSLADLVLSFLECGRSRQARKILETPGLRLRAKKLKACAQRYLAEDKMECLEQFIELTKNLNIIDRQELYDVFLEAYNKTNDWQRGLSLWTEMQDEDVQPNEAFLSTLASLLIRNNQPVPFVYKKEKVMDRVKPEGEYVSSCREAIAEGNLEKAEKILSNVHHTDVDLSSVMSELIDEHVKRNDFNKACKLLDVLMLKHMRQPRSSCLKSLWNAMIENKEFDKLRAHEKSLSTTVKKNLRFQKYLNRANLAEYGLEKCLEELVSKVTESKTDNLKTISNILHFTSYLDEFKNNPSIVEKFKPTAEKLAEQEIFLPINMMWCYYLEKNLPEANEVWSKYLTRSNWIVFNYIIDTSKKTNNIDLLKRLNEQVWTSEALTEMGKMTVLASLVDLYTQNKQYDEAIAAIKSNRSLDIDRFNKYHHETMENLKEGVESNGTTFPFQPKDTRQQSAS